MNQPAAARLNPAQVETFRKEGFLLINEPIFSAAKFDALRSHFEERLATLPPEIRPESMDVPHFEDPALFEWLFDDAVLDLVEPLVGPDIALFSSHFICKPKGNGKRVPWHEDSAYWKGMVSPMEVTTVWLALDPSTLANGCMSVIPRTHTTGRAGFSDYDAVDTDKNVFTHEITRSQRDESRAVPCELHPNEASLHDARLMHGSEANTSDIRRCGYTMRFMSTAVKFHDEKNPHHQIYLARGRDRAGNVYADAAKAYPEKVHYRKTHGKQGH